MILSREEIIEALIKVKELLMNDRASKVIDIKMIDGEINSIDVLMNIVSSQSSFDDVEKDDFIKWVEEEVL